MTNMKIISAAIPEDLDKAILDFRKRDECIRMTYSEVVRRLLYTRQEMGLRQIHRRSMT